MANGVRDFVAVIPADRRPLFDRVHRLVLEAHPEAELVLSYKMPPEVAAGIPDDELRDFLAASLAE